MHKAHEAGEAEHIFKQAPGQASTHHFVLPARLVVHRQLHCCYTCCANAAFVSSSNGPWPIWPPSLFGLRFRHRLRPICCGSSPCSSCSRCASSITSAAQHCAAVACVRHPHVLAAQQGDHGLALGRGYDMDSLRDITYPGMLYSSLPFPPLALRNFCIPLSDGKFSVLGMHAPLRPSGLMVSLCAPPHPPGGAPGDHTLERRQSSRTLVDTLPLSTHPPPRTPAPTRFPRCQQAVLVLGGQIPRPLHHWLVAAPLPPPPAAQSPAPAAAAHPAPLLPPHAAPLGQRDPQLPPAPAPSACEHSGTSRSCQVSLPPRLSHHGLNQPCSCPVSVGAAAGLAAAGSAAAVGGAAVEDAPELVELHPPLA